MAERAASGEQAAPAGDAPLTIGDFDARIGDEFGVQSAENAQSLRLIEVGMLPGSPRDGGGFRLEFEGDAARLLPQGIHSLVLAAGPHDVFLVPIGPGPGGMMRYEAVFY